MPSQLQFWLSFNNGAEKLQLPVNPESVKVSNTRGYEDVEVLRLGEYTIIGDRRAKDFSLSSFFPKHYGSYCEYEDIPNPYEAVNQILDWMNSGKPVRLTVTNTNINYPVTIRSFDYEERGGSPGDVYFDISLKEYTFIDIKKVETSESSANVSSLSSRPNTKDAPKSYTIKSGDTLWKIAQRTLGDGDRWREIYDKNKSVIGKDPNTLAVGKTVVL